MSLKGFKKPDGSVERIHTDPTLSKANEPADAASVKAKDDELEVQLNRTNAYAAELNDRLSDLEAGAPGIIAPKVTEWLEDNVNPVGSAVTVDSSLTVAGSAADAKKTGDELSNLKSDLLELQNGGYVADAQRIGEVIDGWLNDHPEATTTVQDGAITEAKFADSLKLKAIKDYVTPEMYGAKGDGVTDDTTAFINALASNDCLLIPNKRYLITEIPLSSGKHIFGTGTIIVNGNGFVFNCPTERKVIEGITFEISNDSYNCIKTTGNSDDSVHETLTIKDVSFNGVEDSEIIAVEIGADTDAKVLNCDFNGCGLKIVNSINPIVSDCVIQGCYYGIYNANTDSTSGRDAYACGLRLSSCTILGCTIGIKAVQVDSIHIVNCMVDYNDYPVVIIGTNNPILSDSYFSSRAGNIAVYIARNNSDSGVFGGNGFNTEYSRDLKISNCVALIHGETLSNECISLHNIQFAHIDGVNIEYAGKAGIFLYDCSHIYINYCSIRSTLSGAYAINSYVGGTQADDSSCKYTSIQSDLPIYVNRTLCPVRVITYDQTFTLTEAFSANTWYDIGNVLELVPNIEIGDVLAVQFGGGTWAYGSVSFSYSPTSGNIRVCGTQTLPIGALLRFRISVKRSRPNYI